MTTGRDGTFDFERVPVGYYRVEVRPTLALRGGIGEVDVRPGATETVRLVVVRDPIEAPEVSARVEARAEPEGLGYDDWEDLVRHEARGIEVVRRNCPRLVGRGGTTLQPERSDGVRRGVSEPIIVVDGVPVGDGCFPEWLDPSTVVRIEVDRASGAGARYGSRGAGGVIRITTRRER